MAYFDNASTTFPKFDCVYEETMKIYKEIGVNYSRSNSNKSYTAGNMRKELEKNLKKIYSSDRHEVIINSSATFSLNEIINGLDYSKIVNVYISPFEHNAVYRCIKKKEREIGFNLQILPFNKFELDEEKMELAFMEKIPHLIICNHASNVFGNILPIEKIFLEGKKYDAITVLDSAQTAGLLNFENIQKVSDFLVFAGHKTLYGPSGIGGYLYNKKIKLNPLLYGGTGINSENIEMPLEIPERFEAGSPNILGIIALKLSTEELLKITAEKIYTKKQECINKLLEIMLKYNYDIKIISPIMDNVGVISMVINNYTPKDFGVILSENMVDVRTGLQCAPLAHSHMGTIEGGTIRFSIGYFNEDRDFEKLDEIFNEIF